jgi:hypothetical protein
MNGAGWVKNKQALPEDFPTHYHEAEFWEKLGRAVATFGFLEDVLCRAIFAFTATTTYSQEDALKAYDEWLPKLERTLSDPLVKLIDSYGRAVRGNSDATIKNLLDELLSRLREAAKIRNVLCHGSWSVPDSRGASVPFYVTKKNEIFETAVDIQFLVQLQQHTVDLIYDVIGTVTHMGWQFPGSNGPGKVIWGK